MYLCRGVICIIHAYLCQGVICIVTTYFFQLQCITNTYSTPILTCIDNTYIYVLYMFLCIRCQGSPRTTNNFYYCIELQISLPCIILCYYSCMSIHIQRIAFIVLTINNNHTKAIIVLSIHIPCILFVTIIHIRQYRTQYC